MYPFLSTKSGLSDKSESYTRSDDSGFSVFCFS